MIGKKNEIPFPLFETADGRPIEPTRAGRIAAVRDGLKQLDAGEYIQLEDVEAWVDSWDTPNEIPPPKSKS